MKNSLQSKLLIWLSIAILLISLLATGISFWLAFNETQEFQDDELRQISLLVDTYKTPLNEERILESVDNDPKRIIVMPIIELPIFPSKTLRIPKNLSTGFHTLNIEGVSWRVYIYATLIGRHVAVAQEANIRRTIARDSALITLLPMLVLIPILILVVRKIIKVEMSSLRTLAEMLDKQKDARLSTLPTGKIPNEIAPFVHAINRMLQRINLMNESQRRFIADAAHELRSPLTALSLQAENIERTGSYAISKERLVPLKDGLERSRNLINQLLDLVRQEASTTKLVPVDLATVALATIEEMMPIADEMKIDLGLSKEATLVIDANASYLQLMLRNAIDNALRYTPVGGEVTVRIALESNDAVIEVIDNGPGIPDAEIGKVFEAFYRIPGNTQIGSGLGLAIARSIANQLQGSISLRNRTDSSGLIFCYRQRQSKNKL